MLILFRFCSHHRPLLLCLHRRRFERQKRQVIYKRQVTDRATGRSFRQTFVTPTTPSDVRSFRNQLAQLLRHNQGVGGGVRC